jgi:hypothetical protein
MHIHINYCGRLQFVFLVVAWISKQGRKKKGKKRLSEPYWEYDADKCYLGKKSSMRQFCQHQKRPSSSHGGRRLCRLNLGGHLICWFLKHTFKSIFLFPPILLCHFNLVTYLTLFFYLALNCFITLQFNPKFHPTYG